MKVFSKEKYIEEEGKRDYENNKGWINACDGKEVTSFEEIKFGNEKARYGRCLGVYEIKEDWCIDVEDECEEIKYTMAEFEEMFDEAVEKTLASWEIAGEMAKILMMSDVGSEKIEMYASVSQDQNKHVLDGLKTILFGDEDEHK